MDRRPRGAAQLKPPSSRDRVLDDAELSAVWHACKDDDFGRIVRLLIVLGARRTEVGGLRWSELDLNRGVWVLPKERAKNAREHRLPLPALALSILETVPRVVNRDCLFGERSISGFTLWAHAKAALDARLGDKVKSWTLHDLRRTFCTRLADLGTLPHLIESAVNIKAATRAVPQASTTGASTQTKSAPRWRCGATICARWSRAASARSYQCARCRNG
jgi:integrase